MSGTVQYSTASIPHAVDSCIVRFHFHCRLHTQLTHFAAVTRARNSKCTLHAYAVTKVAGRGPTAPLLKPMRCQNRVCPFNVLLYFCSASQIGIAYGYGAVKWGSQTHNTVIVPYNLFSIKQDPSQSVIPPFFIIPHFRSLLLHYSTFSFPRSSLFHISFPCSTFSFHYSTFSFSRSYATCFHSPILCYSTFSFFCSNIFIPPFSTWLFTIPLAFPVFFTLSYFHSPILHCSTFSFSHSNATCFHSPILRYSTFSFPCSNIFIPPFSTWLFTIPLAFPVFFTLSYFHTPILPFQVPLSTLSLPQDGRMVSPQSRHYDSEETQTATMMFAT